MCVSGYGLKFQAGFGIIQKCSEVMEVELVYNKQ